MASEMTKTGYMNINQNQDMNVLTPERTVGSQLIFRENTAQLISGKNVLILMASVSTGYTAKSAAPWASPRSSPRWIPSRACR